MRPRHTTAIALAASLACHACLMALAVWFGGYEAAILPRPRQAALLADPAPPPPNDPLGARDGLGDALAAFEAPQTPRSPHDAQDQPLMGLAEHGPLRLGDPGIPQLLAAAERSVILPSAGDLSDLAAAVSAGRPVGRTPSPPDDAVAAQLPVSVDPDTQPARPARELASAAAPAATDPGPPSEREVDLFTQEASADWRAGQTVAREGREFKIRGLRRGLAAFFEQAFLPRPITIRFLIKVDAEGTPLLIEVEKSSGSDLLDQTIRKDLFNSWFDPDPSGDGKDVGKPFHFSLRIE